MLHARLVLKRQPRVPLRARLVEDGEKRLNGHAANRSPLGPSNRSTRPLSAILEFEQPRASVVRVSRPLNGQTEFTPLNMTAAAVELETIDIRR